MIILGNKSNNHSIYNGSNRNNSQKNSRYDNSSNGSVIWDEQFTNLAVSLKSSS